MTPVQPRVAFRVVTHEHLGERGVELLDVPAEVVSVLEVEFVLTRPFDGHRERVATRSRGARDLSSVLLVDQHPCRLLRHAVRDRERERLEDQVLRVDDARVDRRRDRRSRAEQPLLERPAMVEREQVQRSVVSELHLYPPSGRRQRNGATSWSIDFGPHDPGAYGCTGGGLSSSGIEISHSRSMPSDRVNSD